MESDLDRIANRRDAPDLGGARQRLWAAHEVGVRAARYLRATDADGDRLCRLLVAALDKWMPYQGIQVPSLPHEGQSLALADLTSAETLCQVVAATRTLLHAATSVADRKTLTPVHEAVMRWQRDVAEPLRGYAFWELFGRSRLGANVFYCRAGYQAVAILESLGEYEAISSGVFTDYGLAIAFADGGLLLSEPLYLGLSGARIVGFGALRYFLRAADLSDPPRFRSGAQPHEQNDWQSEPWRLPQDSHGAVQRAWQMMARDGTELSRIARELSQPQRGDLT